MEEKLDIIIKSLAHIESLLQRMPEMIAAAAVIEEEHAQKFQAVGRTYEGSVILCPVNRR